MAMTILATGADRAGAETPVGLDNPTLSFNLATPRDYGPGLQFLDLTKMMRPWIGHEVERDWGGMNNDELLEGGFIDAEGWVIRIPPGFDRVGTIWSWGNFRRDAGTSHAGRYILEYEGEGELELRGDATVVSSRPGRIIFQNEKAGTFVLNIMQTDPNNTGNYIRNISIVAEKYLDLYRAGGTFNPAWLETLADARELRFMDWTRTNGSRVTSWSEMPSVNSPFSRQGVAIEDMVQLANELGADPWFTMPHLANEEYIRNFATYVRDNLDPALSVRAEYSNEAWNWSFRQTRWLRNQSSAEWGQEAHIDNHAKKAVETALIWEDVFSDADDADRLINVLGTHAVNAWLTNRLLTAPVWRENEPDSFVDPKTVFEEIATTTYFGGAVVRREEPRTELIAVIKDPSIDANAWLAERLMDPTYESSIPNIGEFLRETAEVAHANGMRLVAYEGGQHVHHSFAVEGLTEEDIEKLNAFMASFIRSEEMADLYRALWDVWKEHGDGAFMQFTDIGSPGRWGTWGLRNSLVDVNPRSELLKNLNATTEPWWDGAEAGDFRQQGITQRGTNEADTMTGTLQEDYLLGGGGDDSFVAGKGNDGINGGAGTDRVLLTGEITEYEVRVEGDGYRVVGPDGSDFLFDVEELAFDEDQVVTLADLSVDTDGLVALPRAAGAAVSE